MHKAAVKRDSEFSFIKLFSFTFICLLLINTFNAISSYMINPVLPSFLLSKGIPFELTGIISSILSWVALFFRPFSGLMTDKYNKKKLLFVSYLITTMSMLGYAWCNDVFTLIIVRIIHGIAFSVSTTISIAFATTFVPKKYIAEGLAYLTLGTLMGSMFGPQIGSMISDSLGESAAFLISGLLSIVSVLLIFLLPYHDGKKGKKKLGRITFDDIFAKELCIYLICISIFSFGNGIISYYLKDFGDLRGISNITIFYTINSIAMLVFRPFVSRVHDKSGISYVLFPAFVLSGISMILLAHAYTMIIVLIAAVLKALGQGCATPALQAESVKQLHANRSGVAVSTCLIGQDLGNAIGPMIGAIMIEQTGYNTMFYGNVVLLMIGFIIFFLYQKKKGTLSGSRIGLHL